MTLEMGKNVKERRRDHLRGRFLPLVLREGVRIDGPLRRLDERRGKVLPRLKPTVGHRSRYAWNFRWRWALARSGPQSRPVPMVMKARSAHAALDAGAGRRSSRSRAARGGSQRHHLVLLRAVIADRLLE